ncbi:MAG: ribbon-helix-helix protein, CopG family [bacterium]|nr:ribbon-helix-helix protein, CopG family [bacterium]
MSTQLTVRLPEDLSHALSKAATRMRRKRSQIVRLALSQFLQLSARDGSTPASRVSGLIGSLESGVPDLAENHRAYVLDSLKDGR